MIEIVIGEKFYTVKIDSKFVHNLESKVESKEEGKRGVNKGTVKSTEVEKNGKEYQMDRINQRNSRVFSGNQACVIWTGYEVLKHYC